MKRFGLGTLTAALLGTASSASAQEIAGVSLDSSALVETGLSWASRIAGVLIALLIARWVAGRLASLVEKGLNKRNFDNTLTKFFARMTRVAVMVFAVLGCLGVFGIETASFAAVLAAAGLAVGLAFQGTLSNFASGIMLLVFRPFKVGQVIRVAGEVGTVDEIELFTTTLNTPDNRRLILPNSSIFGATIENLTHHDQRRVNVDVGTDYGADVDETRSVLEKCVQDIPGVLAEPTPQVFLSGLGASSVDWQIRVWAETSDYWNVHQETVRRVKMALDNAGIGIPFPQMDLHLDKDALGALQSGSGRHVSDVAPRPASNG